MWMFILLALWLLLPTPYIIINTFHQTRRDDD